MAGDGASGWYLSIYNYTPNEYLIDDDGETYIIPKNDVDLNEIFLNIKANFDSKPQDLYICSMSDAEIEYQGQKFTWP